MASGTRRSRESRREGRELLSCPPGDPAQVDSRAGERMTGASAPLPRLDPYVWHLIFQNLGTYEDFYNLCLVSKTFYSVAVTHLYKTIQMGPRPLTESEYRQYRLGNIFKDDRRNKSEEKKRKKMESRETQWHDSCTLIRRLVGDPNGVQARAVREVDVLGFSDREKNITSMLNQEGGLAALVKALPNLKHFRLHPSSSYFEDLIRELNGHANQPQLHLLGENGSRVVAGPLPCVTTLCARVNPSYDTRDEPNRRIPCLQQLFFACPNLKSFSFSTFGGYGGCVMRIPHHPRVYSFQCTGEETFPPLESLSFNYIMGPEEWPHWRDKLDWSNLRSLSLGPKLDRNVLESLTGCVNALQSLTVETWAPGILEGEDGDLELDGEDTSPELERFLMGFDTLEQLTVRGISVSNFALTKHSGLKQLCLHAIELPRNGARRPTLDVADLNELDANCPDLEMLELDIYRDIGWPRDMLKTLATGFVRLRHLTLHCEIGIGWGEEWFLGRIDTLEPNLPRLDRDLATEFAQPFFTLRSQSRLERITLKTGETLRRFPQWEPPYRKIELAYSETICIRAPFGSEGELVVDIED